MLPAGVRMIHGPGCPVCVTPLEQVDKALAIAARPDVIFTSYGDMLRVPGKQGSLEQARQTFNDAIRYQEEAYDRQGVAITRWNLGELLLAMGEKARAVELMELAITYEKEIGHPDAVKHQARLAEVNRVTP
jgi:hydrogenase expression/formation protein HypD